MRGVALVEVLKVRNMKLGNGILFCRHFCSIFVACKKVFSDDQIGRSFACVCQAWHASTYRGGFFVSCRESHMASTECLVTWVTCTLHKRRQKRHICEFLIPHVEKREISSYANFYDHEDHQVTGAFDMRSTHTYTVNTHTQAITSLLVMSLYMHTLCDT